METLIVFIMFGTNLEKGTFDHSISFPNVWELLRTVMMNLAAMATCEHSFSMMKLIWSDTRSSMNDWRMHHLAVIKHYPKHLKEPKVEDVMSDFTAAKDIRLRQFGCASRE